MTNCITFFNSSSRIYLNSNDSNHNYTQGPQYNTVQALFENKINIELIKASLKNKFYNEKLSFKISIIQDQDWVKLTQSQFHPINIDKKLWIIPTWHKIKDKKAINLILDPGLAFGTGSHATTHLCLSWLIKNVNQT